MSQTYTSDTTYETTVGDQGRRLGLRFHAADGVTGSISPPDRIRITSGSQVETWSNPSPVVGDMQGDTILFNYSTDALNGIANGAIVTAEYIYDDIE